MLKKLAKYGNSTTLVIDKAILELLNMNESSVVKLHTDGKSLIITPVPAEQAQEKKVSYEGMEGLIVANSTQKAASQHKESYERYAKLDEDVRVTMQKEFSDVFAKYMVPSQKFHMEIMQSPEFVARMEELALQYDPAAQSEEYFKAFNALRNEFVPEMIGMDEELAVIAKKYEYLNQPQASLENK